MSEAELLIRERLHAIADKLYIAQFHGDYALVNACLWSMRQIIKQSKQVRHAER